MIRKIFASLLLLSIIFNSGNIVAQTFTHSIDGGINLHIHKSIRDFSRPSGVGSSKDVSAYYAYKLNFKPKKANAVFGAIVSYRNNVIKYYYSATTSQSLNQSHISANNFLVGFSLEVGSEFVLKNKSSLQYGCGIGALYSLNDMMKYSSSGITFDYKYPTAEIDSSHYLITDIQTIKLAPTMLAYFGYNFKVNSNLIFCCGVRLETSFFEGHTQSLKYIYYKDNLAHNNISKYVTTNNSSIIFKTGVKFSKNIF